MTHGPHDAYLDRVGADQRAALERLRRTIRATAPRAEECMSYGLPAFRLDGKLLVALGATASHCALYPMSAATVAAHRDVLAGYDTSKGTIRFRADAPPPAALVRRLVKARMAENAGQTKGTKKRTTSRRLGRSPDPDRRGRHRGTERG